MTTLLHPCPSHCRPAFQFGLRHFYSGPPSGPGLPSTLTVNSTGTAIVDANGNPILNSDGTQTYPVPQGWQILPQFSDTNGTDQFVALVNTTSTQQIVFAFKGTSLDNLTQPWNDVSNLGYGDWAAIRGQFRGTVGKTLRLPIALYATYQVNTDGHKALAAAPAATAALINSLNG